MLNDRIRALRLARGISQVELARRLGVSKQSVSNWENDNIQPSIEMLVRLARCLNTSTDYLLGLDDQKTVDVDGLSEKQIQHIKHIIEDIKEISEDKG